MTEQNIPVVLTIRYIDKASYTITELSESEINEYLAKLSEVKFCSKCFNSVKFNNIHHMGLSGITKKLEITCFLDGKRSCLYDWDQAQSCLNKIKSGKDKCSEPFVIKHILPLLAKGVQQKIKG